LNINSKPLKKDISAINKFHVHIKIQIKTETCEKRHKNINGKSATAQLARREQQLAVASALQGQLAWRGRLLAEGEQKWVATTFRPFSPKNPNFNFSTPKFDSENYPIISKHKKALKYI